MRLDALAPNVAGGARSPELAEKTPSHPPCHFAHLGTSTKLMRCG